jgi:hypothetical protein
MTDTQTVEDEIAADIRKAQADCVRRGWFRDLGNSRFEITETGRQELFERLATPETYH